MPDETPPPASADAPMDELWTSDSATVKAESETAEVAKTPAEPVAATEPDTQTEPVAKADETPGARKPKPRDNPYARVKDATAEAARERDARTAAESRAAELEARLKALEQARAEAAKPTEPAKEPAAPPAQTGLRPRPDEDDIGTKYQKYADFVEDMADWKHEQRFGAQDIDARIEARLQLERQQRQLQEHIGGIYARGKAAYPDFEKVIAGSTQIFSPLHREAILRSPHSEHVQYALAKDPALAARIAALDNPFELGLAFAQLVPSSGAVARPDSAQTARVSTANPPINRVGGTASAVPVDPDDLEFGPEYIRVENAREKKRAAANRW